MGSVAAGQHHLVIRTEVDGENVRLCVIDNGTGIAPQNLKSVFDAFWTSKAGGIGVGLAICKSIIAAHQGTLTASNNVGPGATFCATWPVRLRASLARSEHG
jgi:signal transduction histidine kinase